MAQKQRISRSSWPWGRTPPTRRVEDIQRMIDQSRAQIPIIEDQAREAIRRLKQNISILEEERKKTLDLIVEQKRSENKKLAYRLARTGIDRMSMVDEQEDQDRVKEILLELLRETNRSSDTESEEIDDFLDSMKE